MASSSASKSGSPRKANPGADRNPTFPLAQDVTMKIAVCIKQVPAVSMLKFDNETRRIVRDGVPNEVNPYDVLGLSLAARLKAEGGVEVVAITMGPPQARDALIQAMAMGADRAVHLNDRAFAGSDTLATSRALALALGRENPDLIICGRNSTDAETGQVGPEVAEMLGIPQITAVSKLDLDPSRGSITATRLTDEGHQDLSCDLPVLVTVTDGVADETYPRREQMEAAQSMPVEELTAADLTDDTSQLGLDGSPTWVNEIFSIESSRLGKMVRDLPTDEAVSELMDFLHERGVFGDDASSRQAGEPRGPRLERGPQGAIWVLAETLGGAVRHVTLELLGRGRDIAAETGTTVEAVLIGDEDDSHVRLLTAYGADTVHLNSDPALAEYDTESHTSVLAHLIERHSPFAVLIPSTANGRDLAARVAGRLGLGLTGDCVGLEIDDEGRLAQLKPAFGGSIVAPIVSKTLPNMATVRPGILTARAPTTLWRASSRGSRPVRSKPREFVFYGRSWTSRQRARTLSTPRGSCPSARVSEALRICRPSESWPNRSARRWARPATSPTWAGCPGSTRLGCQASRSRPTSTSPSRSVARSITPSAYSAPEPSSPSTTARAHPYSGPPTLVYSVTGWTSFRR